MRNSNKIEWEIRQTTVEIGELHYQIYRKQQQLDKLYAELNNIVDIEIENPVARLPRLEHKPVKMFSAPCVSVS